MHCYFSILDDDMVKRLVDIHNHVTCTKGDNKYKVELLLWPKILNE